MEKIKQNIKPGDKGLKSSVSSVVLFILGRGLQSASKHDPDVIKELEAMEDGTSIIMNIMPKGPKMCLIKDKGRIYYKGGKMEDADLVINFKNIECAFMMFTAQVGTAKAYAEHRMSVKGDLAKAMILIRCLNILEGHLFPKIINKRILKQVPPMGLKKQGVRLIIYTVGIPFGL